MGWLQSVSDVTRGKPTLPAGRQADAGTHDWYAPLPDIPECYRRNVPCEPCPTAVKEAERVVRSGR
jgi:hypothetical protein